MNARGLALQKYRHTLLWYLYAKANAQDWHGVCDAANDLRELEAEMRALGIPVIPEDE